MLRRNEYEQRFNEHLQAREWSADDIARFGQVVHHSALISYEGALEILELQQEVDERIEAEKAFDSVFDPNQLELGE